MIPVPVKTFVHTHKVYRLEYPAHWDQVAEKDGESCGFGPHDRDGIQNTIGRPRGRCVDFLLLIGGFFRQPR